MEIRGVIKTNDLLGEGPIWSIEEQAKYWVDIWNNLLRRWEFSNEHITSWEMPSTIGSVALRELGGFIVAHRTGLVFFDPENGRFSQIVNPEENLSQTRFNDGKCD